MANSPANTGAKIQNALTAWKTLAPAATFGGMTLAQFVAATKPSFDAREAISEKEDEMTALINGRNDADKASLEKLLLVVNGVKGDPNFGEDSDLYDTMGYVRKSERASGLTRKKQKPATP
jgi:hypothetical protein